jgi:hypothetical protein
VTAGIARLLGAGRVVVFGTAGKMFAPLRSFGYRRPLEYEFSESGSLAEALRREISTGRQQLVWEAASDERFKLMAMGTVFYIPLVSGRELAGFFAFSVSPVRLYSGCGEEAAWPAGTADGRSDDKPGGGK